MFHELNMFCPFTCIITGKSSKVLGLSGSDLHRFKSETTVSEADRFCRNGFIFEADSFCRFGFKADRFGFISETGGLG